MSTEENKAIYLRTLDEIWSQGREEVYDELYSPEATHHDGEVQMEGTALERRKQRLRMYRRAAPDLTFEPVVLLAEGDLVACYYKGRGTHAGEILGTPPTGRRFEFKGVDIVRIRNSKIVEGWDVPDLFGVIGQLGLLPIPKSTSA